MNPEYPPHATDDDHEGMEQPGLGRGLVVRRSQVTLATILIVATLGTTAMWLMGEDRERFLATGIYFVLVPGLLAALVSVIPISRNQTRLGVFQGTTIGILASAIVLREGFVCVLIALPLVLPIAGLVVYAVRSVRRGPQLMIPFLLVVLSGEGIVFHPSTNIDVVRERTVTASPSDIEAVFERPASAPAVEPLLLRAGFPRPTAVDGEASDVGDRVTVRFDSGGRLELELVERRRRSLTWVVVDDTSPVAGWLTLHRVEVAWDDSDDGPPDATDIQVALEFDRMLAPAFYFDPLERWGVGELGEVILDMVVGGLEASNR